jgi:TRAP-type uncharacterized transport system fused permease subunit
VLAAVAGIVVLSAALEGYALRRLTLAERALALAAGLSLVVPPALLDAAGTVLIALLAGLQALTRRRAG